MDKPEEAKENSKDGEYDGPPPPDEFKTVTKSKAKSSSSIMITPAKVKVANDPNSSSVTPKTTSEAKLTAARHASTMTIDVNSSPAKENDLSPAVAKGTQHKDERSFFVSKIIYKKDNLSKERDLTLKLNAFLAYTKVDDNPKKQQVALEVHQSDIDELELTEIGEEQDHIKPTYEVFGSDQPLCKDHADIASEWKINNNCPNCYIDCCGEWRFGQYCVSAVERYWDENKHSATLREAYIHFIAHYNCVLDWHLYGEGFTHKLRKTQVTKPPYCMRKGSLKHAIQWIKWQIENGSEKEWYDELRRRKRLKRMEKETEEEHRKKEFKIRTSNTYRNGLRNKEK